MTDDGRNPQRNLWAIFGGIVTTVVGGFVLLLIEHKTGLFANPKPEPVVTKSEQVNYNSMDSKPEPVAAKPEQIPLVTQAAARSINVPDSMTESDLKDLREIELLYDEASRLMDAICDKINPHHNTDLQKIKQDISKLHQMNQSRRSLEAALTKKYPVLPIFPQLLEIEIDEQKRWTRSK